MSDDHSEQTSLVADLQAAKDEYKAIFDAVSEAIFLLTVDENGTIRYQQFNQREEEFTGKSTEDVRGKTPIEVFGEDLGGELRDNYRTCLERKESVTYEEELHTGGAATVWRTTLTPIIEEGQVQQIVGNGREITKLRESERELERQLSFLENTSDVITVLDRNGIGQYQNHCREHLPGANVLDVTDKDPSQYIHPDDREMARETFASVLETPGATARNELRIEQERGGYGWYEQRVVNLTHDPAVGGVLVSSRDIFDRKEQERKLEGIFQAARDVSFIIADPTADGTDATIREFSPGAEQLFGYDRDEAIGTSVRTLQRDGEIKQLSQIHELMKSGESYHQEVEHVRKNGTTFDALLSVHPLELRGQTAFLAVSIDISERKERERALERLHASARDLMTATTPGDVATIGSETATEVLNHPLNGIHLYDEDANALVPAAWTDSTEQLLDGQPPALPIEESLGGETYRTGDSKNYTDLTEEGDRLAGDTPFRSELILPLGDHGVFILSSPSADRFDQVDMTLAKVLTATIETALDRVEQRKQLERQNERLDEFASVLSHDLRNPLNVAKGRLELAQTERDSEHLDAVGRAHTRIQTLIEDLLTLAREGDELGELEPVELDSFIKNCWRNVKTENATIVSDIDRTVRADRSRLKQLLENLFRNAVEHAGTDSTVTVGAVDDGFFIADDGPGIAPEAQEEVFDVGYSTSDGGNGFGLSIVKRIARAHGWTVRVTEGMAGGARFEIGGVDTLAE